ncbi:MAG: glycoside hydrolase family 3 C-terminal domain-containing protein, partial [Clostridia bacterium]|nr:glycoside hydrolase family 3 C-terminal domain-containing protein [Clostridia bacterium]
MKNKRKFFRRTVSVILTLCLIASSSVCAFASSLISEETTAKSKEIANMIESEGIVLLKNEDDALPLKERKVNVFGAASCSIAFAGAAGSGAVRSSDAVGFYDALTNAGIEYNKDLYKTYASHTGTLFDLGFIGYIITVLKQFFGGGQSEMPVNKISDKLMSSAVEYSDNAIIVIGRVGTEMKDLSVEQLNLTADEKEMIDKVCSLFDNVIVVFNISNIMDMSWIEDYDSIKAAMIMWLPGEVGTDSVGKVLTGEVNPSGKLVDTVSYDIEDHPASENFGNYMYKGILGIPKYFVNYSEGIYVGYRYFETLAPEKVQYPFGFGLSYTDFEWNVTSYSANDEKI